MFGGGRQAWAITNTEAGYTITNGYSFVANSNVYVAFSTSGSITITNANLLADIYTVSGGGSGGSLQGSLNYANGGSPGGVTSNSGLTLIPQTYTITIGAGGAAINGDGTATYVNAASSFSNISSAGGAYGTTGAQVNATTATQNMWNSGYTTDFLGYFWTQNIGGTGLNYYAAGGGWQKRTNPGPSTSNGNSGMPVNTAGGFAGGAIDGYQNSGSGGAGSSVATGNPVNPGNGSSGVVILKLRGTPP